MSRAIPLLIVVLIALSITSIVYSQATEDSLRDRVSKLYVRVYNLGREGINVTKVVSDLNRALGYIDDGRYDDADKLLNDIESEVSRLEDISGDILFWSNFYKYSTVAILISIPIATYFILPRIYIEVWYRLRRRWIARR